MKQGDDIIMREQSGAPALGAGKITRQINDGCLHTAALLTPITLAVDPGAALFSRTGIEIH